MKILEKWLLLLGALVLIIITLMNKIDMASKGYITTEHEVTRQHAEEIMEIILEELDTLREEVLNGQEDILQATEYNTRLNEAILRAVNREAIITKPLNE